MDIMPIDVLDDKHLKPNEVAKKLRISRSQVYAMVSEGKLPALKIDGSLRFPSSLLRAWIKENTTGRKGAGNV